jgi:hypothetical protein
VERGRKGKVREGESGGGWGERERETKRVRIDRQWGGEKGTSKFGFGFKTMYRGLCSSLFRKKLFSAAMVTL